MAASIVWDLRLVPQSLRFSTTMLTTIGLTTCIAALIRADILQLVGARVNGELQVAAAFAAYHLPFIMAGFWGHLHAKVAAQGATAEVKAEFEKYIICRSRTFVPVWIDILFLEICDFPILFERIFCGQKYRFILYDWRVFFQISHLILAFMIANSVRKIILLETLFMRCYYPYHIF